MLSYIVFLSPGQNLQHWFVSCICASGGQDNVGHITCAQDNTPSLHVQLTQPVIENSPCSTSLWLLSKQVSVCEKKNSK